MTERDENGIPRIPTRAGTVKEVYHADDGERLYTYFELAIMCGVTPAKVRSMMHESRIRPENSNRGTISFFRETKVRQFLKEQFG